MNAIVRKKNHETDEALLALPKRTSHEADRELAHLQKVLGKLSGSSAVSSALSSAYWMVRLRELRVGYALIPVQLARISALECCIEELAEQERKDPASFKRRAG